MKYKSALYDQCVQSTRVSCIGLWLMDHLMPLQQQKLLTRLAASAHPTVQNMAAAVEGNLTEILHR